MPTLTVNLAYDAPDSGVELDDDLDITVQALNDVVREDAGVTYVINPWPLKLSLVNGQGAIDLAAGYYWVHHPWGSKLVSLQADARLDQLDAIDPATLDPDEPMSPAWQAMLDALGDRVTQLEEAGVGEPGPPGDPGPEGPSAYEVAVAQGFAGDEAAWLASLKGADGEDGAPGGPGPEGPSAYEVAVAEGFVGDEAAWLASLQGEDGAPGAAGGLKVYASEAEFTAETETITGILAPATNWGAFLGNAAFNTYAGPALVQTVAHLVGGVTTVTQIIRAGSSPTSGLFLHWRRKSGAGAYSAWSDTVRVGTPVAAGDATSKSYVDNRFTFAGSNSWTNTAALDAYDLDSAQGAISNGIADMGAYTGLSAYNGLFVGIPLVEHYAGSAYPKLAMVQRLKFTDADGNFVIIQRKKTRLAPAAWSTWSAWVIV